MSIGHELMIVVGLALLPALGNLCGGLLAELAGGSPRFLNWALHASSGIIIAIVAVGIMPRGEEEGVRSLSSHFLGFAREEYQSQGARNERTPDEPSRISAAPRPGAWCEERGLTPSSP